MPNCQVPEEKISKVQAAVGSTGLEITDFTPSSPGIGRNIGGTT